MTRPGRKRKARVNRDTNGRIQRPTTREREQDVMAVAQHAPHRQILGARGKVPDPRDPRLGTEFGRLRIMGLITKDQYAAGQRWGRIVIRMCRAIAAPPGAPTGVLASLAGSSNGNGAEMSPEDALEARKVYQEAYCALVRDYGLRDRRDVPELLRQVIVDDRACLDLIRFRGALDILARHFEATEKVQCRTTTGLTHGASC